MPEASALIRVEATGGDAAAQQLGKAASGFTKIASESDKASAAGRRNAGSFRDFYQAVNLAIPGAGQFLDALKDIKEGSQFAAGSVGKYSSSLAALAPVLLTVGAALGAGVAVWIAERNAMEAARLETEKNYKAHTELAKGFDQAITKGVKLTEAQRDYVVALKAMTEAERQQRIIDIDAQIKAAERGKTTRGFTTDIVHFVASMTGLEGIARKTNVQYGQMDAQVKKLIADKQSLSKTGKTVEETLRDQGAAMDKLRAATEGAAAAEDDLQKARKPVAEFTIEAAALARAREARIQAAREQIQDQALLGQTIEQINKEYSARASLSWIHEADRIRKANEDAAKKTRDQWESATSGMRSAAENFGVGFIESVRKGGVTGAEVFKNFADAAIMEIERIIVKAAVARVFTTLIGGPAAGAGGGGFLSGLFGAANGGVVPGPEGAPRMILAHGGETVTSTAGRSGGQRGGGDTIINNNIGGAFVSQRQLVRSERRSIRSTGEAGLA